MEEEQYKYLLDSEELIINTDESFWWKQPWSSNTSSTLMHQLSTKMNPTGGSEAAPIKL